MKRTTICCDNCGKELKRKENIIHLEISMGDYDSAIKICNFYDPDNNNKYKAKYFDDLSFCDNECASIFFKQIKF